MSLTAAAIKALMAQNGEECFLELLTLEHVSFGAIRLVRNNENITSRGNLYTRFPFEVAMPADVNETLSSVPITASNVDLSLMASLRAISDPIAVTVEVIAASAPDVVQQGPYRFDLTQIGGDEVTLSGVLSYEPVVQDPFPAGSFTPQSNPGQFGRT